MRTAIDCVECGRPIITYNKKLKKTIRPKQDHDLCQKCWKSTMDRHRYKEARV